MSTDDSNENVSVSRMEMLSYIPTVYKKLLFLDNDDFPLFVKINNILVMTFAPMVLIYDVLGGMFSLPFHNIINIHSFAWVFTGWILSICLVSAGFYLFKRYKITSIEDHIVTFESEVGGKVYVYTTDELENNKNNNINEDNYILIKNTFSAPPVPTTTYDNKILISIFSFMVGTSVVESDELVEYLIKNYRDDEKDIDMIFEDEDNELRRDISSQLVLENL